MSGRSVEELFREALPIAGDHRHAFLDSRCGDDPELLKEVELLLACDERQPPDFLDAPFSAPSVDPSALELGSVVGGRYKLLQQIGEGGMSLVFLAEQKRADGSRPGGAVVAAAFSGGGVSDGALREVAFDGRRDCERAGGGGLRV